MIDWHAPLELPSRTRRWVIGVGLLSFVVLVIAARTEHDAIALVAWIPASVGFVSLALTGARRIRALADRHPNAVRAATRAAEASGEVASGLFAIAAGLVGFAVYLVIAGFVLAGVIGLLLIGIRALG